MRSLKPCSRLSPSKGDLFSNEENLPLLKNIATEFPVNITDALDQLEELNPPSEAEDAHDEVLAGGESWSL